ncbi:rhodanese-like domain-containing protein [Halorussus salinus]|uniref:rhodanese-like domain-containing protein n=1 Tax=Halorussus salinus TaxID=1364935 RepID=UPI001091D783|nr:rhodanese-like domain-containing protein [Halorussus salinus]
MDSKPTTRRRYLLTAGTAATAMLAGCQSGADSEAETTTAGETTTTAGETTTGNATTEGKETTTAADETTESDDYPEDTNPDDGYAPEFEDQPSAMEFDPSSWPTRREEAESGSTVDVPLVPLDVAHNLYARREARMLDARATYGYEVSHVLGAVRSPSPTGADGDPTGDWPTSDTIIAYCHCPHHLAVKRAANLLDEGYENVYALQNGYQAWTVADHPTAGKGVSAMAKTWTITGTTDASDAGGVAYVYNSATDHVAGAEIDDDGSYAVEFSSASVSKSDTVTVGTPSYEITASLSSVTEATVTADFGTTNGTANRSSDATTTVNETTMNGSSNTTSNSTLNPDGTSNTTDSSSLLGRFLGVEF